MTVAMLFALQSGAEMVIMPDPRNIDMVLEIIQNEQITIYPVYQPCMWRSTITRRHAIQAQSIRACLGAAALPVEVASQFEELTGGKLVEGFGMTECSPVVSANPLFGESGGSARLAYRCPTPKSPSSPSCRTPTGSIDF
ncbi:MAG: AMP-binding protein [Caldilineaceae bacterium]